MQRHATLPNVTQRHATLHPTGTDTVAGALRGFCRGYGSVGQLEPLTVKRHVFVGHSNEDATAEHIRDCWAFVTGNMREAALQMLVDDDLLHGLTAYLKNARP